ncbi:MAG: MFS transporter [Gammaproteobacteria bacterium]
MFQSIKKQYDFFFTLSASSKFIILNSLIFSVSSFMIMPFLAIFLSKNMHMSAAEIGILLAIVTFISYGGSIVGGIVTHWIGLNTAMILALILRSMGFILLATATIAPKLSILATSLIAMGSAIYMPANKAYTMLTAAEKLKPLFVSISNATVNMGMAIGPLITTFFIHDNPIWLFNAIAFLLMMMALLHKIKLQNISLSHKSSIRNFPVRMTLAKIWYFLFFNIMTFYVYLYFQDFIGLYFSIVSNLKWFGLMMFINFTLLSFLQMYLAHVIARLNYKILMSSSFLLLAIGVSIISIGNVVTLFLGSIILTIGSAFLFLRGDLEIVNKIPEYPAIAFGIQRLSMGVSGILSGIVGGKLFQYYHLSNALNIFWLMVSIQCLFVCFLVIVIPRQFAKTLYLDVPPT